MERLRGIKLIWAATALAVIAGIIYNSWPLGFWLNPFISDHGGVASELQGLHEPYNWLFNLLDILTGLLVIAVVALLWRAQQDRMSRIALLSLVLFAVCTIADTMLPVSCISLQSSCPSVWVQPIAILHGIASIGAALGLFISALLASYRRPKRYRMLLIYLYISSWVIAGVFSLLFLFTPGPEVAAQDYFLINCGIWLALIPPLLYVPMPSAPPAPAAASI